MSVHSLPVNPAGEATVSSDSLPASGGHAAPLRNMGLMDQALRAVRERPAHLPGMLSFTGPSGFGKSFAAAFGASRHQAYYIEVRESWTRKAMLLALARQMGMEPARTIPELVDQAAEQLAVSGRPLIIDEMDNAVAKNLIELIRDLYESSQAPMILIGEERLPHKLAKWERFHGRILDWWQAAPAGIEDARALNRHYLPRVVVHDELLQCLVEQARGSVRRICTNLHRIGQHAISRGLKEVTPAEWSADNIHSGQAPKVRRFA